MSITKFKTPWRALQYQFEELPDETKRELCMTILENKYHECIYYTKLPSDSEELIIENDASNDD